MLNKPETCEYHRKPIKFDSKYVTGIPVDNPSYLTDSEGRQQKIADKLNQWSRENFGDKLPKCPNGGNVYIYQVTLKDLKENGSRWGFTPHWWCTCASKEEMGRF